MIEQNRIEQKIKSTQYLYLQHFKVNNEEYTFFLKFWSFEMIQTKYKNIIRLDI